MTFFHSCFGKVADAWFPGLEAGEWDAKAARRRMGAFFHQAAKRHGAWGGAPARALSELSYQRRSDDRPRYREHLFEDPRFVAEAIKRGLANEVLEDSRIASAGTVRDAALAGIAAIQERPSLALSTLVNRLRNRTLPSVTAAYLRRAEVELSRAGAWLRAESTMGAARTIRNVAAVSPLRGVFHTVTDSGHVETYTLATHERLERTTLPTGEGPLYFAADPLHSAGWRGRAAMWRFLTAIGYP